MAADANVAVGDYYANCPAMKAAHGCALLHQNLPGDCLATCPVPDQAATAYGISGSYDSAAANPTRGAAATSEAGNEEGNEGEQGEEGDGKGDDEKFFVQQRLLHAKRGQLEGRSLQQQQLLHAVRKDDRAPVQRRLSTSRSYMSLLGARCMNTTVTLVTRDYGVENSLKLNAGRADEVALTRPGALGSHQAKTYGPYCLPPGYHTADLADSYGDGWHGGHVVVHVVGQTEFLLKYELGHDFLNGASRSYAFRVGDTYSTQATRRHAHKLLKLMSGTRRNSMPIHIRSTHRRTVGQRATTRT